MLCILLLLWFKDDEFKFNEMHYLITFLVIVLNLLYIKLFIMVDFYIADK